jgi:hypothetical protein
MVGVELPYRKRRVRQHVGIRRAATTKAAHGTTASCTCEQPSVLPISHFPKRGRHHGVGRTRRPARPRSTALARPEPSFAEGDLKGDHTIAPSLISLQIAASLALRNHRELSSSCRRAVELLSCQARTIPADLAPDLQRICTCDASESGAEIISVLRVRQVSLCYNYRIDIHHNFSHVNTLPLSTQL